MAQDIIAKGTAAGSFELTISRWNINASIYLVGAPGSDTVDIGIPDGAGGFTTLATLDSSNLGYTFYGAGVFRISKGVTTASIGVRYHD